MTDEMFQRVEKLTELHAQINAIYRAIDELGSDGASVPDASDAPVGDELTPADEPHTHAEHDHKTLYAAPDSNDAGVIKALLGKFQRGLKPGQSVVKAADGKRLMLIVTSNSYKDRDDETLTSQALKEDVDRHWTQGDDVFMSNNPLLFWHDDDIPVGEIIWGDMVGPFYVEVGKETNNPLSRLYFDYREAHPEEKWGASHRFAYYSADRSKEGDYARIFKQETTTLPLEAAANLITLSEVLPMSDKRSKKFDEIMGFDGAYQLLKTEGFDALSKKLSEQGVEHKSVDAPDFNPDAVGTMAKAFVQMVADAEEQDKAVAELSEKLTAAEKAFNDKTAELDTALKAVNEKQAALDAQLSARPSSASRSDETVVTNAEISKEVNESLLPKHPTFNVPYPANGA